MVVLCCGPHHQHQHTTKQKAILYHLLLPTAVDGVANGCCCGCCLLASAACPAKQEQTASPSLWTLPKRPWASPMPATEPNSLDDAGVDCNRGGVSSLRWQDCLCLGPRPGGISLELSWGEKARRRGKKRGAAAVPSLRGMTAARRTDTTTLLLLYDVHPSLLSMLRLRPLSWCFFR